MESKYKKLMKSEGIDTSCCKDRLSELPDEVIVHILSFMPTLDAVRTMSLRRFRNLWTLVPLLKFDLKDYTDGMIRLHRYDGLWTVKPLFTSELDEYYDTNIWLAKGPISWVFPRFSEFVRKVLTFHKSPMIETFHISIDEFIQDVCDDVQMWLTFAVDKGVKDLSFDFRSYEDTLPSCVFTSQSLVTLSLSNMLIEDQPRANLPSLRKLSLIAVRGSDQAFEDLISGCPALQGLFIDNASELRRLKISNSSVIELFVGVGIMGCHRITLNCPALKLLGIGDSRESLLYKIKVIDVSSLKEVNVKILPYHPTHIKAFISQFRNVEVLTVSHDAFSQLGVIKFDYPQTRWKRLILHPNWTDKRFLKIILYLVAASVKLEDLIIKEGYSSLQGYAEDDLLCPEISTSMMPLLKTVTVHCNDRCLRGQLKLVELLLRNATVLEKTVIKLEKKPLRAIEEHSLVKLVSRFTKASTNATVVFA